MRAVRTSPSPARGRDAACLSCRASSSPQSRVRKATPPGKREKQRTRGFTARRIKRELNDDDDSSAHVSGGVALAASLAGIRTCNSPSRAFRVACTGLPPGEALRAACARRAPRPCTSTVIVRGLAAAISRSTVSTNASESSESSPPNGWMDGTARSRFSALKMSKNSARSDGMADSRYASTCGAAYAVSRLPKRRCRSRSARPFRSRALLRFMRERCAAACRRVLARAGA